MSKVIKYQFDDFFQSRKKKLINMLFSEIIFLRAHIKKAKKTHELYFLKNSLDKLEYLLNLLRKYNSDLPEDNFDKILMIIYHIFQNIAG